MEEGNKEGVQIVIALADGHGSYTAGHTQLRGWFDVENGHFVIPFQDVETFNETMGTLGHELGELEQRAQRFWRGEASACPTCNTSGLLGNRICPTCKGSGVL